MSGERVPTKEECCEAAGRLLSRALGRLVRAEAAGTLTPAEARVMAAIRAREARETAAAATADG